MNETERCLNMINAIDDSVLLSEGYVLSNQVALSEKVDTMLSVMGDAAEMYMTEASVGTGISYDKSSGIIMHIWTFIRRVVHAIINKVSDLMTKLKIRKYENVKIPMSVDDIKSDIDAITGIFDGISGLLAAENADDIENYNYTKDYNEMKPLLKKVNSLKIFKVKKDDKPFGIKPDEFMKMRDKIRYLNQQLVDINKKTDKYIKTAQKNKSFSNKSFEQYCRITQQIFAKMNEATTKLFSSFKFNNVKNVESSAINATNNTADARNILNQLYSGFIEYAVITETAKPFDDYLRNHDYDPKTNTIMHDKTRVKLPKILSNKEINRANKFLRENNYDPKTETIETDVVDDNGNYERVKFIIDPTLENNATASAESNGWFPERDSEAITMGIAGRHGISGKPIKSNQTFKHEEGHFNQRTNIRKSAEKALSFDGSAGDIKNNINNAIDVKNREGIDEDVLNAIKSHHDTSYTNHDKPIEYDADLYALRHNRYASGKDKDLTALRREITIRQRELEKKYGHTDADIERYAELYVFNRKLNLYRKNLETEETALMNLQKQYESEKENMSFIEKIKFRLSNIRTQKKVIHDIENDMKGLSSIHEKYMNGDKTGYNENGIKLITNKINQVMGIINSAENVRSETAVREDFLRMFSNEAGSQARKLEGRQGKHKGKK